MSKKHLLHEVEVDAARLEAILASARGGVVSIDSRGEITLFNQAAQEILGYDASEVFGRNVGMLMPSPYRDEHDGYIRAYQETGEARAIGRIRRVEGKRRNGEVFP